MMPDRGGGRSDAQRNREAILRAAAEVLAEDPAASMDDVATRAGVGRATMYRHVTGRADLLHQLASWALASATRAVEEARIDDGAADAACGGSSMGWPSRASGSGLWSCWAFPGIRSSNRAEMPCLPRSSHSSLGAGTPARSGATWIRRGRRRRW
ncbi:MAG: helix-turn-helix transcriptional regulator [Nigerium sp.]|nr:helix-turn-helix transcriptional regulator [Nigerium sp.]